MREERRKARVLGRLIRVLCACVREGTNAEDYIEADFHRGVVWGGDFRIAQLAQDADGSYSAEILEDGIRMANLTGQC